MHNDNQIVLRFSVLTLLVFGLLAWSAMSRQSTVGQTCEASQRLASSFSQFKNVR